MDPTLHLSRQIQHSLLCLLPSNAIFWSERLLAYKDTPHARSLLARSFLQDGQDARARWILEQGDTDEWEEEAKMVWALIAQKGGHAAEGSLAAEGVWKVEPTQQTTQLKVRRDLPFQVEQETRRS
jgi:hypothetical protein